MARIAKGPAIERIKPENEILRQRTSQDDGEKQHGSKPFAALKMLREEHGCKPFAALRMLREEQGCKPFATLRMLREEQGLRCARRPPQAGVGAPR